MSHLLVTNDFPPKVGGIQTYLWELWRRLPAGECTVLTASHPGAAAFDASAPLRIVRTRSAVLWPTPSLAARVDALAAECGASLVVLDPALPLGLIGPLLSLPYAVVVHGAEVTVPARLPVARPLLARVLRGARFLVAAGGYPADRAHRVTPIPPPTTLVPPGVDTERFVPLTPAEREVARKRWSIGPEAELVVSVSRLVPRKGMDTLIRAAARLSGGRPRLEVAIAGTGRDRRRLEKLAASERAPVRLLGRVSEDELPLLYGAADLFVMDCRDRWAGLEQEGFGIVFLEAAACAVPQIAGVSGGSQEAVEDGITGVVLRRSKDVAALAREMSFLLDSDERRARMGEASRRRVERSFGYDQLAASLLDALREYESIR